MSYFVYFMARDERAMSSCDSYEGFPSPPSGVFSPVTMDIVSLSDDVIQLGWVLHNKFFRRKPWWNRVSPRMTLAASIHPIDRHSCSTSINRRYIDPFIGSGSTAAAGAFLCFLPSKGTGTGSHLPYTF